MVVVIVAMEYCSIENILRPLAGLKEVCTGLDSPTGTIDLKPILQLEEGAY